MCVKWIALLLGPLSTGWGLNDLWPAQWSPVHVADISCVCARLLAGGTDLPRRVLTDLCYNPQHSPSVCGCLCETDTQRIRCPFVLLIMIFFRSLSQEAMWLMSERNSTTVSSMWMKSGKLYSRKHSNAYRIWLLRYMILLGSILFPLGTISFLSSCLCFHSDKALSTMLFLYLSVK